MRWPAPTLQFGLLWIVFLVLIPLRSSAVADTTKETSTQKRSATTQSSEDARWAHGKTIRGKGVRGYIAFTFDDGPNPKTTPAILDILSQYKIPATFFVVGRHFTGKKTVVQRGARLLVEMEQRGFTIGNHTTNHKNLSTVSIHSGKRHIAENAESLHKILGYRPRLFRAPFGATSPAIRKYLRKRGDTLVSWNIDPRDFRERPGLRKLVLQSILAKSGGVIVMHDTKQMTVDALPGILQDLEDANCRRLSQEKSPILPVSLQFFMRSRKNPLQRDLNKEMSDIHQYRHHLWERCQRGDLSN